MKAGILLLLTLTLLAPQSVEGFNFVALRGDAHTKPIEVVVVRGQKIIAGNTLRSDIAGYMGGWDIFLYFVMTGNWLLVGGSGHDEITDVFVHEGSLYLTGSTTSSELGSNGIEDALIAKITDGSTEWVYTFGGNGEDRGDAVGVDESGIFIAGSTTSNNLGEASSYRGNRDAFISGFSHKGELQFFEYAGGSDFDLYSAIHVQGEYVFTFGTTGSPDLGTESGFQTELSGGEVDSFIAKYGKDGDLIQMSYFGHFGSDVAKSIVGIGQSIYLVGQTSSWFLPGQELLLNYTDTRFNFFIAMLDGDLSNEPTITAVVGGNDVDLVESGQVHGDTIYLAGSSRSDDIEFEDTFPWEARLQNAVVFQFDLSLRWLSTHAYSHGRTAFGQSILFHEALNFLVLGKGSSCGCIETYLLSQSSKEVRENRFGISGFIAVFSTTTILMLVQAERLSKTQR